MCWDVYTLTTQVLLAHKQDVVCSSYRDIQQQKVHPIAQEQGVTRWGEVQTMLTENSETKLDTRDKMDSASSIARGSVRWERRLHKGLEDRF